MTQEHTFTGFHSTQTGWVMAQLYWVLQDGGSQYTHLPKTFFLQPQQLHWTPEGQHTCTDGDHLLHVPSE